MAWNIAAACAHTRIAPAKSSGRCAKYVRMFMEAGGMSTAGRPVAAWHYMGFLPKKGFSLIAKLPGLAAQRAFTANDAKPGDIAVMDHGEYGHICMWNGARWVSDFVQKNMWVYRGQGVCYVWRYTGKVVNVPTPMGRIYTIRNANMVRPIPLNYAKLASSMNDLVQTMKHGNTAKKFIGKFKKRSSLIRFSNT